MSEAATDRVRRKMNLSREKEPTGDGFTASASIEITIIWGVVFLPCMATWFLGAWPSLVIDRSLRN
jgi:hypothetical protein